MIASSPRAIETTRSASPVADVANLAKAWSDEQLVVAMIDRAPAAWREFAQRFDGLVYSCIYKVIRRFARIVPAEDAGEIAAALRVSLLSHDMRKLRGFDPSLGFRLSSWIGRLATNCAYDHLRSLRREPVGGCITDAAELASDQPDPFETAALRERTEIATSILEAFSPLDRRFAALYFGEELAPTVIAATLNISIKTVYSKKHKIQARMEQVHRSAA